MLRGVDLASICWLLVCLFVCLFFFFFFFFFCFLFFSGFLVDCGCGLVGFDLDQLVFFLVHWWVLMILPPIGWVMIWLDCVLGWVGDEWVWD